jgi:uncharacterized protein YyaL (SSP411 family)
MTRFHDPKNGGFFQSGGDDSLLLRLKEDYDGAEPSGNSVAALALLKLGKITDRREFTDAAVGTLELFASNLSEQPQSVPSLITALDFLLHEPNRLVIAGRPETGAADVLLGAAHRVYQPNKVILGNIGPVESFARTLPAGDGVTAFVCSGTFCHPPTQEATKVAELMLSRRTDETAK